MIILLSEIVLLLCSIVCYNFNTYNGGLPEAIAPLTYQYKNVKLDVLRTRYET